MTLEQFYATHRVPNAIVVPAQKKGRSAATNVKASALAARLRSAPESTEKH